MSILGTCGLRVAVAGRPLCHDLTVDIDAGSCWGVLGRNGSGKTTLLHTLAGLRPPTAGTVLLNGEPLTGLPRRTIARQLAVLFQDQHDHFPGTALDTVMTGRHPHLGLWQREGPRDLTIARGALEAMGIAALEGRMIDTLSGGERRRLEIAAALAQEPRVLLLDEPANHLDLHQQIAVLDVLRHSAPGRAVVMTLHDVNLAARYCDRVLMLFGDGEAAWGSTARMLTEELLSRLYRHPIRALAVEGGTFYAPR